MPRTRRVHFRIEGATIWQAFGKYNRAKVTIVQHPTGFQEFIVQLYKSPRKYSVPLNGLATMVIMQCIQRELEEKRKNKKVRVKRKGW